MGGAWDGTGWVGVGENTRFDSVAHASLELIAILLLPYSAVRGNVFSKVTSTKAVYSKPSP